jgi:tRNA threonylcarbamoyl adenosine modification protein YeaZ
VRRWVSGWSYARGVLVLAIDTATPAVTAGVADLDAERITVTGERITLDPRAHGELLTPHILDATRAAGVTLRQLDAIVCGAGPGPYTGLRAGMATAAALGQSLGIPVHPVCSLDAVAHAATHDGPLLVVTDARRREVYWATYGSTRTRTDGPHVDKPADVEHRATVAAGQGAQQYAEILGLPTVQPAYPTPAGLVAAARADLLAGRPPAALTPMYLRRPDAAEPGTRKRVSTP